MGDAKAIIVVEDAVLASSLELVLLAAGLTPLLCDPDQDPRHLPLDMAATVLILGPRPLAQDTVGFVEAVRVGGWLGLVILITGDCGKLRSAFKGAYRVAVLEMPFVAADLIATIRRDAPSDGKP